MPSALGVSISALGVQISGWPSEGDFISLQDHCLGPTTQEVEGNSVTLALVL